MFGIIFGVVFAVLFLTKNLRLIISGIAFNLHRAIPVSANTSFLPGRDVAVVIPTTLSDSDELLTTLRSILDHHPARIILVTSEVKVQQARDLIKANDMHNKVSVISVPEMGKRMQMVAAIKQVRTPLIVFADDDVIWPSKTFLGELIAPFADSSVGGTGPGQCLSRPANVTVIDFFGMCYLLRRVWNTVACNYIDGGLSTLSGRTNCVRASLLQNEDFYHFFNNMIYAGQKVVSDDDKTLTRWIFRNEMKIKLQASATCTLETNLGRDLWTLCGGQMLRWERAKWRGNFIVQENETYWYKSHPWTCFSVYAMNWASPAMIFDASLLSFLYLYLKLEHFHADSIYWAMIGFAIWICILSKCPKLVGHWWRYPQDLRFLPATVLFSYLHGVISLYARFTLSDSQGWAGRPAAT